MKKKTLSERIAERQKTAVTPRHKNKAVFLALRDEIDAAMKSGWPMKTIWETLTEEKKVSFTYETFRVLTNEIIKPEKKPSKAGPSPAAKLKDPEPDPKKFKFDPVPNKKDLY